VGWSTEVAPASLAEVPAAGSDPRGEGGSLWVFLLVVAIVFEEWRTSVPTDGANCGVTPSLSPSLRDTGGKAESFPQVND